MSTQKYDYSVVLMTALLPTIGHQRLCEYAAALSKSTIVIVSGRSYEPTSVYDRINALGEVTDPSRVSFAAHIDDAAPQEPNGPVDDEFWAYWAKVIQTKTGLGMKSEGIQRQPNVAVVSSEPYGQKIAEIFNWDFVPYDLGRDINSVKGSDVRGDLQEKWKQILPEFQWQYVTDVVIMGPESCGKTTLAKKLSYFYDSYFLPEWARGYLETVGSSITDKKMDVISRGQFALEDHASDNLIDRPFRILDTDIYSTIGYYHLWDKNFTRGDKSYFVNNIDFVSPRGFGPSDLYIIMNDKIPFEPDPLRYGGDKRESDTQFWIDLARREGLPYIVMESTDPLDQMNEAIEHINRVFKAKTKEIREFVRD